MLLESSALDRSAIQPVVLVVLVDVHGLQSLMELIHSLSLWRQGRAMPFFSLMCLSGLCKSGRASLTPTVATRMQMSPLDETLYSMTFEDL